MRYPTFAKITFGIVDIFFFPFLCSFWIHQCHTACKNYPHMYNFRMFALFWYCKTSTGAQCKRCEKTLWEAALRDAETQSATSFFENNNLHKKREYLEA